MNVNDASLKSKVKNFAQKNGLMPQEVLQMYLFERFLKRLGASRYVDRFVLKGGLLIASITGIAQRTTMDMDATLCGLRMEESVVADMMEEICRIPSDDGISFRFERIEPIREDDEYENFRAHIVAELGKIKAPMKIDLTTGDAITPCQISYPYPLMFEKGAIDVMAYTLETVIAEKFETAIRRGTENGRARDFYDLHALFRLKGERIDWMVLRTAVENTANRRGSFELMSDYRIVCEALRESDYMHRVIWAPYCADNPYAENLDFDEVVDVLETIGDRLNLHRQR